jgi:hypothetical protein
MSDDTMDCASAPSRRKILQLSAFALAAGFSSSSAAAAPSDLIVSGTGMARMAGAAFAVRSDVVVSQVTKREGRWRDADWHLALASGAVPARPWNAPGDGSSNRADEANGWMVRRANGPEL